MQTQLSLLIVSVAAIFFADIGLASESNCEGKQNCSYQPVYIENFERYAIGSRWQRLSDTEITGNCRTADNKCLRISYRPVSRGSPVIQTQVAIPPGVHYQLSYDIFFEPGFEFVKGGKLPGLSPLKYVTGCLPEHAQKWSARVMWRKQGKAMAYYYGQNRKNRCGDGEVSAKPAFKSGVWQQLVMELKLNSKASSYDGLITLRVDGRLVAQNRNIRLRGDTSSATEISQFFLSTFYGGNDPSWSPSKTTFIRLDNIVVQNLAR